MEDLQFNITDCENANITTPNVVDELDLISEMQESPQIGSANIEKYTIEYGKNCCGNSTIDIPVFYNFERDNISCTVIPDDTVTYGFSLQESIHCL